MVNDFDLRWFLSTGLPSLQANSAENKDDSSQANPNTIPEVVRKAVDGAIQLGASDLHWEPNADNYQLRIRLNGSLISEESFHLDFHPRVTTHLKVLADMDISERRRPQDGRIRWNENGKRVDIRVSTVPGSHGEKTVLRILDSQRLPGTLAELGMDQRAETALTTATGRTRGLILITGPTGSGKSTSLYTLLKSVDREHRNVMTVEDPVEYEMKGVTQVSVDQRIGRTFATVLKSFLRQDPDILLVGEVRDLETAEICIRASLTGHLVLSTLHTNDSVGSITRLLDMGVPQYLLSDSLSIICSQRLLRQLCSHCKTVDDSSSQLLKEYGLRDRVTQETMTSEGCENCKGTGVTGRIGIFETLIVSPALRDAIRKQATTDELESLAIEEGMIPLLNQGVELVNQGLVQLNEVLVQVLTASMLGG